MSEPFLCPNHEQVVCPRFFLDLALELRAINRCFAHPAGASPPQKKATEILAFLLKLSYSRAVEYGPNPKLWFDDKKAIWPG